ncbi:MAG: efflux RND transporter permease subunit [Sumerlaeia bacterium]
MTFSATSVRRPVTTLMVFLAIVVLGVVSYRQLPLQLVPNISVPALGVYMNKPDASANEVLQALTRPVEGIISEVPRVKSMQSWTGGWGTWIRVELEQDADLRMTTLDLQERLISFQQELEDRRTVIEIFPFSTNEIVNLLMEVAVEGPSDELIQDVTRDKVEPALKAISGVAKVEVGGLTNPAADVEIVPALLGGYGLEFEQVFSRIQSAATEDTYLGSLEVPEERHYVRLEPAVKTMDELADLSVGKEGAIRLDDVARIAEGESLDSWVYRRNGNYAIGIRVDQEEGENLVAMSRKVRERLDEINESLPTGVQIKVNFDAAEQVLKGINEVRDLALIGALLSLLVPLLFFHSARIAAIIFVSVPISIIAVFNLFYAADMSINIFSIVGLALAVGMLVDNSIVVVENCYRLYFSRGMSAEDAAAEGGTEIGRALFASTLTTIVFFVPFSFIEGDFKAIVREPAFAFIFPLIVSLGVALTLSAMLTGKALKSYERKGRRQSTLKIAPKRDYMRETYRFVLKGCLRHRGAVSVGIVLFTIFVFMESSGIIREETSNRNAGRDVFNVFLILPPGTLTAEASGVVAFVEDKLLEHEDIENISVWFRGDSARFDVELKERDERPSEKGLEEIRANIVDFIGPVPGGEAALESPDRPQAPDVLGGGEKGVLVLKGLDFDVIEVYAQRLIDALTTIPAITRAQVERFDTDNEYHALIDREKARLFNLTPQILSYYVNATRASGTISSLTLRDGEDRTDVTISLADAQGKNADEVRDLAIYAPNGSTVSFGELATFRTAQMPGRIYRKDRQSSLSIEYFWVPGADQGAILEQVKKLLAALPNPGGVVTEIGGAQQTLDQQQKDFMFCLQVSILLIFVVMAATFESWWVPLVIVATTPLAMLGIVAALAITKLPFNEMAAFGVLLLIGVIVNNGIVLLDTALRYRRDKGWGRIRAVFQASDQRLRPILMTFLTTFLGLMPMALTGDEDSIWRPVAVTVVGGLTSATFLTLIALPCFYLIGDDFVEWAAPYGRTLTRGRTWWGVVKGIVWGLPKGLVLGLWRSRFGWRVGRAVVGDVLFAVRRPKPAAALSASPAPVPQDPASPAIVVQNLHVTFAPGALAHLKRLLPTGGYPLGHRPLEGTAALSQVSLEIRPGLFGLLGPNGAGKTTLMRCIAGLQEPARGTVRVFDFAQREAGEALAPLIGYLPQTHGHYDWMTLREYLEYFATISARTARRAAADPYAHPVLLQRLHALDNLQTVPGRAAAIARAAEEVHLEHVLDKRIGQFSGGMRQRAGIARVLLSAPPILIVDEPTAGLDPLERVKVRLLLARLARTRTVIFSTHIVEDLEDRCDAIGVLSGGRLLWSGPTADFRAFWGRKVWEVPANGQGPDALARELVGPDVRLLYRYARAGSEGWRVIAAEAPHPRAITVEATLEDALLGELDSARNHSVPYIRSPASPRPGTM